jgi:hypothetical protein
MFNSEAKRLQPLLNGDFKEFADDWPKSSQKSLSTISKLLSQYGLTNLDVDSDSV